MTFQATQQIHLIRQFGIFESPNQHRPSAKFAENNFYIYTECQKFYDYE